MRNRTNQLNRWLLSLLGTLFVLLGAGGVLMGAKVFGDKRAVSSVIYPRAAQLLHREQSWLWWVLGAAALLIALLALYWVAVQLRVERIGAVTVQRTGQGDSTVASSALSDVVAAEAEALPEVEHARARLMNDTDSPELVLSVWLQDGAELGAVRTALDTTVLRHARESLGLEHLQTWLRIEVDAGARERVH
jgi:hypothetical protein